jgi:hypothetical protein
VEVAGLFERRLLREVRNPHDIDLGLDRGDLVIELRATLGERFVLLAESGFIDHPGLVKVVELVSLLGELLGIPLEDSQELDLLFHGLVGLL